MVTIYQLLMVSVVIVELNCLQDKYCSENGGARSGRHPKIVGGFQSKYLRSPWLVDVKAKLRTAYPFKHLCGGSIITERYVLTAGHCFYHVRKPDNVLVVAGEFDLEDADLHEESFRVQRIIIHPNFQKDGLYSSDIALVNLKKSIRFEKIFKPICMSSDDDTRVFQSKCFVTGWGAVTEDVIDPDSRKLREVEIALIETNVCRSRDVYGDGDSERKILDSMLCAGNLNGGVDACSGDSGGPLTCYRNHVPYLVGIVSWGEGCAKRNKPGVYTRVSSFRAWIGNITGP